MGKSEMALQFAKRIQKQLNNNKEVVINMKEERRKGFESMVLNLDDGVVLNMTVRDLKEVLINESIRAQEAERSRKESGCVLCGEQDSSYRGCTFNKKERRICGDCMGQWKNGPEGFPVLEDRRPEKVKE